MRICPNLRAPADIHVHACMRMNPGTPRTKKPSQRGKQYPQVSKSRHQHQFWNLRRSIKQPSNPMRTAMDHPLYADCATKTTHPDDRENLSLMCRLREFSSFTGRSQHARNSDSPKSTDTQMPVCRRRPAQAIDIDPSVYRRVLALHAHSGISIIPRNSYHVASIHRRYSPASRR